VPLVADLPGEALADVVGQHQAGALDHVEVVVGQLGRHGQVRRVADGELGDERADVGLEHVVDEHVRGVGLGRVGGHDHRVLPDDAALFGDDVADVGVVQVGDAGREPPRHRGEDLAAAQVAVVVGRVEGRHAVACLKDQLEGLLVGGRIGLVPVVAQVDQRRPDHLALVLQQRRLAAQRVLVEYDAPARGRSLVGGDVEGEAGGRVLVGQRVDVVRVVVGAHLVRVEVGGVGDQAQVQRGQQLLVGHDGDGVVGDYHQAVAGVADGDLGDGVLVGDVGVEGDAHAALLLEHVEDGRVDVVGPVQEVDRVGEPLRVAAASRLGRRRGRLGGRDGGLGRDRDRRGLVVVAAPGREHRAHGRHGHESQQRGAFGEQVHVSSQVCCGLC